MKSLRWLREQGELMNKDEASYFQDMSIAESAKIFAMLYKAGRPMFDATRDLFRPEREKYLTDLQRRLYRIGKWEKRRDRTLQKRAKTPKKTR